MQEETRFRLGRIQEMSGRAWRWSYAKGILNGQGVSARGTVQFGADGRAASYEGECKAPTEEATTALADILRYFTQRNENIHLYTAEWLNPKGFPTNPTWYNDPDLSTNWKALYDFLRDDLHAVLGTVPMPTVAIGDQGMSFGMAYEVFLYGEISHSTKQGIVAELKRNAFIFAIAQRHFHFTLMHIMIALNLLGNATKRELNGEPIDEPARVPLRNYIRIAKE